MTQRNRTILAAVIIAAAIATLLVWKRQQAAETTALSPSSPVPPASAEASTHASGSPVGPAEQRAAPDRGRHRLDAAARQELLARIAHARAQRGRTTPTPSEPAESGQAPSSAPVPSVLDKAYVQAQIRELAPMLVECYQSALRSDRRIGGKLVVEFTISGEPEIGGLVDSSEVLAEESSITDPEMVACVRDTMYSAEFVPPEDGGQVTVRYPFTFQSDE